MDRGVLDNSDFHPAWKIRARLSKEIGQIPKKLPSFLCSPPRPMRPSTRIRALLSLPFNAKKPEKDGGPNIHLAFVVPFHLIGESDDVMIGPGGGGIARKDSLALKCCSLLLWLPFLAWKKKLKGVVLPPYIHDKERDEGGRAQVMHKSGRTAAQKATLPDHVTHAAFRWPFRRWAGMCDGFGLGGAGVSFVGGEVSDPSAISNCSGRKSKWFSSLHVSVA